jgi:hypothetical protein
LKFQERRKKVKIRYILIGTRVLGLAALLITISRPVNAQKGQKTICANDQVPPGMVIVGVQTDLGRCSNMLNNIWVIDKPRSGPPDAFGNVPSTQVCWFSPVPAGYVADESIDDLSRCQAFQPSGQTYGSVIRIHQATKSLELVCPYSPVPSGYAFTGDGCTSPFCPNFSNGCGLAITVPTGTPVERGNGVLMSIKRTSNPPPGGSATTSSLTLDGRPLDFLASGLQFTVYGTVDTFLHFAGSQSMQNGSVVNMGPAYFASDGSFPYVMFDSDRNLVLMHPGTFATVKEGASLGLPISQAGVYSVSGVFARANNFRLAGDGVQVAVIKNREDTFPLFVANISADHEVDSDKPFSGSGVAPFNLTVTLNEGRRPSLCCIQRTWKG